MSGTEVRIWQLMTVGGCRVVVLSPLLTSLLFSFPFSSNFNKPFFIYAFQEKFSPSTPLYPDRNIACAESSLIASSTSPHLATPSPLKKWLDFIIFNLSNSCVTLLSTLIFLISFSTSPNYSKFTTLLVSECRCFSFFMQDYFIEICNTQVIIFLFRAKCIWPQNSFRIKTKIDTHIPQLKVYGGLGSTEWFEMIDKIQKQ